MPGKTMRRHVVLAGLLAAVYVTGVGALLAAATLEVTVSWWPTAGFGLVALLLTPPRSRPAVAAVLLLIWTGVNLTVGRAPAPSVLLGLANTVEAVVVSTLLLRWTDARLRRLVDTWLLVLAAACGALVAALAVAGVYAGWLDRPFGATALVVGAAHLASLVVLGPLAMLGEVRRGPGRQREVALHTALLLTAAVLAYGPTGALLPGLGLTPLPLLVWAAARFEVRTVVLQLVALGVVVSTGTALGWGPFPVLGRGDATTGGVVSQVYMICAAMIALPLVQAMRERERALARTAASERVFRRSFTQARVPVLLLHRERGGRMRVAEANAATARLLGRPADELVGRDLSDLLTGPPPAGGDPADADPLAGWSGPMGVVGQPRARLDGVLSLLEDQDDRTSYSLHLLDLTEPLELADRLRAERTYSHAVIESASGPIVVTDAAGTVVAANPASRRLTGYSEAELVGRPIWETVVPEHQRLRFAELMQHLPSLPRSGEATVLTRDGEHRAVLFSNAVHAGGPDEPVTLVFTATDVTDARQSAGMVRHLLRSATTMAFVGTDPQGRITLFNPGAERMVGIPAERALGRRVTELLRRVEDDPVTAPPVTLSELLDGDGSELGRETRDWVLLADGRAPLRVSLSSSAVTTGRGTVSAYLFVAHDVTDTRRSQQILVNALRREREVVARLRELDRAKDDFVSTVSHELRTPMSSIIGSAEMLLDGMVGELDPRQRALVEVVERNGGRLLALADDLLLLATSDAGSRSEQSEELDLRDVVRESISCLDTALTGRRLQTRWELPDEPVPVRGEPRHLERAVTNLLTNAVKFTPDGGSVALRVSRDPEQRTVRVEVSDTGLGIRPEEIDQVFDRFYRSSTVQEQAIQGSGLGLAIVRTIVEAHDGRVEVASAPGEGTTFGLTLPLRSEPRRRAAPALSAG